MKNKTKNKKYCENRECENNVLFSCNAYGNMPSYYVSSGETGDVQYGIGARNNNLKNSVQAEGAVPMQAYINEDESKKNRHKN